MQVLSDHTSTPSRLDCAAHSECATLTARRGLAVRGAGATMLASACVGHALGWGWGWGEGVGGGGNSKAHLHVRPAVSIPECRT